MRSMARRAKYREVLCDPCSTAHKQARKQRLVCVAQFTLYGHGGVNKLITLHGTYNRLGLNACTSSKVYAALFEAVVDNNEIQVIRNAGSFQCQQVIIDSSIKLSER